MADRGESSLTDDEEAAREEKRLILKFGLKFFPSERILFSSKRRWNESMVSWLEEVEEKGELLLVLTEKKLDIADFWEKSNRNVFL